MRLKEEIRLKGIPVCRGIAIGKPFFFALAEEEVPEFSISAGEVEKEVFRYREALSRSCEEIKRLQKKLKRERILEGASILDAHLHILQDPLLTVQVEEEIRKFRKNAESMFQNIVKQFQEKFQALEDPFFRERFRDLQDISRRVMGYLRNTVRVSLGDIPSGSIVFSLELTASDMAEVKVARVGAFVTTAGGATSHAAIVAKAKGIPYVTNIPLDELAEDKDATVIVDGRTGEVFFHPTEKTLDHYMDLQAELKKKVSHMAKSHSLPPETIDGCRVQLSANIDMTDDVDAFHKHGGKRVGLFRSENMFLANLSLPTEEEQFQLYVRLVKKMKGLPIVIRTFDFGGDKLTLNPREGNSYFGFRALRYLLKEREVFKTQLRAILRASVNGNVSVMFPMISTLAELVEAKALLEEVYQELKKVGSVISRLRVGSMIEVPSAAIIADLIAKECDFVSIGTNDLVQYALAVDRRTPSTQCLSASADPSVLRMIKLVVSEADHRGIPVTVCGEIAADPRFTALLLGLGVHEFSVAPRYIPVIKQAIRSVSYVDSCYLAEQALALSHSQEIFDLINEAYRRSTPEEQSFEY